MNRLVLLYVGPKHLFRSCMAKSLSCQQGPESKLSRGGKKEKPPQERSRKIPSSSV